MSDRTTIITAGWVAPMDRPAFRDGAVVVSAGRIVDVGDARDLTRTHAPGRSSCPAWSTPTRTSS
jgi:hypothetical protein